jgi:4'-phosphopantetheinyl transferase EntD
MRRSTRRWRRSGEALPLLTILPAGAVAAEIDEAEGEDFLAGLHPEERAAIEGAGERRRREFAAGRECARRALRRLGVEACALPVGGDGAPVWPPGIVGSITHKGSYRAAAVARVDDVLRGIGIDAEVDDPLPTGVLETIATPVEVAQVEALLGERPGARWDRLLFSAKEAAVKAARSVGPVAGVREVVVRIDDQASSYTASTARDDAAWVANGAWMCRDGLILTAAGVPSGSGAVWTCVA